MTGAGDEMENVGRSIERAQEKTEDMEARAAAMDELEETGAFENVFDEGDDIDRELESMRRGGEVEAELETLKAETGGEGGDAGADADADADVEADAEPAVEETPPDPEIEAELDDIKAEEADDQE
jgi:phage shock protein A